MQSIFERRATSDNGGQPRERGVKSVQCLSVKELSRLIAAGTIHRETLDAALASSQVTREALLATPPDDGVIFLLEYRDGWTVPVIMLPTTARAISVPSKPKVVPYWLRELKNVSNRVIRTLLAAERYRANDSHWQASLPRRAHLARCRYARSTANIASRWWHKVGHTGTGYRVHASGLPARQWPGILIQSLVSSWIFVCMPRWLKPTEAATKLRH